MTERQAAALKGRIERLEAKLRDKADDPRAAFWREELDALCECYATGWLGG